MGREGIFGVPVVCLNLRPFESVSCRTDRVSSDTVGAEFYMI